LCFTPQIIAENGQKIPKLFLVYVSGTLCMNCNKYFEKKTQITKFDDFYQNLQAHIFEKVTP
jgi:hypothetical protein